MNCAAISNWQHNEEQDAQFRHAWRKQKVILTFAQLRAAERERTDLARLIKTLPEGKRKQAMGTRQQALLLSLTSEEANAVRQIAILEKQHKRTPTLAVRNALWEQQAKLVPYCTPPPTIQIVIKKPCKRRWLGLWWS